MRSLSQETTDRKAGCGKSARPVWREGWSSILHPYPYFIATNAPHPFLFSFLRYDAGGWGDYTNAVAGKIGAILFAGCVAGVEGEGKDVETECGTKVVNG